MCAFCFTILVIREIVALTDTDGLCSVLFHTFSFLNGLVTQGVHAISFIGGYFRID